MLRFHAGFAVVAAIVLAPCFVLSSPPPYRSGMAVCALVLSWHAAFARCTHISRPTLHQIWRFTCPLSLAMVLPDLFLTTCLGTLSFPDDGAWRIGSGVSSSSSGTTSSMSSSSSGGERGGGGSGVSIYMAGMWSIPLSYLLACFPPSAATEKQPSEPSVRELAAAALLSLLLFGAAEQLTFPLNLWRATDKVVHKVGHVALYVLPAEALLGAATLYAYRTTSTASSCSGNAASGSPSTAAGPSSVLRRVLAACAIALLYTGALAVSYLLIEGGLMDGVELEPVISGLAVLACMGVLEVWEL